MSLDLAIAAAVIARGIEGKAFRPTDHAMDGLRSALATVAVPVERARAGADRIECVTDVRALFYTTDRGTPHPNSQLYLSNYASVTP